MTAAAEPRTYIPFHNAYSSALHLLDWLPVVGTIKNLTELCVQKCWKPNPAQLSPFKKVYYEHINEKSLASSFVLAIPFLGTVFAVVRDVVLIKNKYKEDAEERELNTLLRGAQRGDKSSTLKLLKGTPNQRQQALTACFDAALGSGYGAAYNARCTLLEVLRAGQSADKVQVETWLINNLERISLSDRKDLCVEQGIPLTVKHKFVELAVAADVVDNDSMGEYYLSCILEGAEDTTKALALAAYQRAAEGGNVRAWDRLTSEYGSYRVDESNQAAVFNWALNIAENFSASGNDKAWLYLKDHCDVWNIRSNGAARTNEIIQFYIKIAEKQGVPAERVAFLDGQLKDLSKYGSAERKGIVLAHYLRAAELGHVTKMYRAAQMCFSTNATTGLRWYERAANAGHLPSMIFLGNLYYLSDDERAAFWYEKTAGRDPDSTVRLQRIRERQRSAQDSARSRTEQERAREEDARNRSQREERENAERARRRANANASAGARAAAQSRARDNLVTKLKDHIGPYDSKETLRRAGRAWILRNHPDKHPDRHTDSARVTATFQEVHGLYERFLAEYN